MKYLLILFIFFCLNVKAQEDTSGVEKIDPNPVTQPINKQIPDSAFDDMGVSVSPSSMHLSIKPGSSVVKEIKVKNSTKEEYTFQITYSDFEMSRIGKPLGLKPGEGKYGLSRYINVSPSYFKLKAGEELKLKVTIAVPEEEDAYKAMWTILIVDQVTERPPLDQGDKPNRLSMGIIPTFGFGVYIYQNPPNVKINSLEIEKFALTTTTDGKKKMEMVVKNTGDGISYCSSYVELTNVNTGRQDKLQVKRFTILPQFFRDFFYELPADLPPGKYSAVGVVDFGNSEEIIAAELEFDVP